MYKIMKSTLRGQELVAIINSEGGVIPNDENNTDYQKYLEWVAEGNTPEEIER
jgi:hypothetical protein